MKAPDRFEAMFQKTEGCWVWQGGKTSQGYGQFGYGRRESGIGYKTVGAHRLSWQFYRGEIPEGLSVLHRCNCPSCVNPDHLYLGTHTDNMADRREAGTVSRKYGENNHQAVLTQAQADWAREQSAKGLNQKSIAFKLRVSRALIGLILQGKRY